MFGNMQYRFGISEVVIFMEYVSKKCVAKGDCKELKYKLSVPFCFIKKSTV